MMNRLFKYFGIGILLYLSLISLVYITQNWLTFPGGLCSKEERNLYRNNSPHDIYPIEFETLQGITLEGYHQLTNKPFSGSVDSNAKPLVIFFDGNADDTWASIPLFSKINTEVKSINYPGFGLSEGDPSEELIDRLLLEWISSLNIPEDRSVIWVGRSLGTGIVTKLLYHLQNKALRPLNRDRLVLVTPYNSLWKVGRHRFPWLPVETIMNNRYETEKFLHQLNLSLVEVVLTEIDWVVPHQFSHDLIQVTQGHDPSFKMNQYLLKGFTHNTVLESDELADIIFP